MKGAGMFIVSLRVVNFGFCSHLGCSGKNAIIFSRKRSCLGLHVTKSLLGVKKAWVMPRFPTSISAPFI